MRNRDAEFAGRCLPKSATESWVFGHSFRQRKLKEGEEDEEEKKRLGVSDRSLKEVSRGQIELESLCANLIHLAHH